MKKLIALGFAVAVSHGHCGLFMKRGDELRHFVWGITVVDKRLLQTFKTRTRIRRDVFHSEVAQNLRHQIRSRTRDRTRCCSRRLNVAGVPCNRGLCLRIVRNCSWADQMRIAIGYLSSMTFVARPNT